ncbi:integral membrane protein 2B [Hyperolius riggenbachi]|uniref:integral membrane protein 2B n=1 Tax=Hyperolius riggenbachi TaxID=752182 RepID=UPI0035A37D2D
MVKLTFNSSLAQKDAKKEDENSEVLIIPENKEVEEVVPIGQRRAWCWCMCFGLAFMLAGIVLGGAYLYRYLVSQRGVYFCGIRYTDDDMTLADPYPEPARVRYHSFKERIQILEDDEVEMINVPVPEFADSDPADIVHDFHRKLTAYLDLSLNKCYVIPLNTSIVMPPKNFLELLINIKAGTYLPQSYLIHEQMVVTDRIENVDQLGVFIRRLCQDKETYKLQRREPIRGRQKRSTDGCLKIVHFENRFAVETEICQ